ncbi:Uncharacterised protein [Neisseria gonorrhoeae]|uniref:Uncharacterized protein n=1 Tax=Neisseria gonorrhoeae TaxID=485 RepID=A0A378W070_NEIGO|nr:Uncharacterised protein [Neisseria gonorrhoeae]
MASEKELKDYDVYLYKLVLDGQQYVQGIRNLYCTISLWKIRKIADKNEKWTRDETLVALYLYYIIPFQKVSKDNPVIQEYAEILGRTPSALGMKIGNLGRLDPTLKVKIFRD